MANESYFDLLKDPRWQRLRLELMQRANFSCQECGAKDKMLTVHHGYYEFEMRPWEYPAESLHCLCEECHECAQQSYRLWKQMIGRLPLFDQNVVAGFALALWMRRHRKNNVSIPGEEHAIGLAVLFDLSGEEVVNAADDKGRLTYEKLVGARTGIRPWPWFTSSPELECK